MPATLTLLNHPNRLSWTFDSHRTISVGAASECDVCVRRPLIAPEHFRLVNSGYYCRLIVIDTLIAVRVNGFSRSTVRDHDVISVGDLEFGIKIRHIASPLSEISAPDEHEEFDPTESVIRVGQELLVRRNAHAVDVN